MGHCVNSTALNEDEFAKPMPVIGLYIAGGTLVCIIFMLCDIFLGLLHRKKWLPCHLFVLNSLTLTLLGVATKIPVDLTTIMYSSQDQLSKLTSTTMICISMGFFLPSLGTMRQSECFANMVALTILVVTVIVNVCIQMRTGVIFSIFYPEHALIMFFMLILLSVLWFSAVESIHEKEVTSDHHGDLLVNTRESGMLNQLKYCYVYGYISNPQLVICRTPYVTTAAALCFVCSLIVLEAAIRSLFQRGSSCTVASDYDWSVSMVVLTQMMFIIVGGIATYFRLLTSVFHLNMISSRDLLKAEVEHLKLQFMFYNGNIFKVLVRVCIILALVGVVITNFVIAFPSWIITHLFGSCRSLCKCLCCSNNKDISEFKRVFESQGIKVEDDWTLGKGQGDLDRWIKKYEKDCPDHLIMFLKSQPSHSEDGYIEKIGKKYVDDYRVSCLSVVFLVKVAAKSHPEHSKTLTHTLNDAFKIIYFIDKKMAPPNFESRRKRRFAKEVWKGGEFSKNIKCCETGKLPTDIFSLKLRTAKAKKKSPFGFVNKEIDVMEHLIKHHNAEHLLADMLRGLLSKVRRAIFKDVIESPPEEYEKRTKLGIKFLCKLKNLNDQIQWEPPGEMNIRYMTSNRSVEDCSAIVCTTVTEETGEIGEVGGSDNS